MQRPDDGGNVIVCLHQLPDGSKTCYQETQHLSGQPFPFGVSIVNRVVQRYLPG